jgi:POT family proton-dependent oligopeptide transporter
MELRLFGEAGKESPVAAGGMTARLDYQPGLFGHPRGLVVLAGTELWDRLSFAGMQAILVLYMVERLLLPGHVDQISGFETFRRVLEVATGPLTIQALASQIFGLYVGFVALTPIFGGWLGDRVLGRRRSVIGGALLMTAGHFCMAFEQSFLAALSLLILGAGLLRGNLAPQLAELYGGDDRRRAVAFQVYACVVSLGAFVAPLVTGLLSQLFDWDVAFAAAGFGMLIGLVVYLSGAGSLPPVAIRPRQGGRVRLRRSDWRRILALIALLPIAALFWIAQSQIWNTYNIWVRDHVELRLGSLTIPVPWLQSLDGLAPLVCLAPLLWFWGWQARRGAPSDEYARMRTGLFIFSGSVLLLAAGQWVTDAHGKVPLLLPVAFHFASNIGWLYFAPSVSSLFAGAAPPPVRGTMIGVSALAVFLGALISGRIGALYATLSPASFWVLHAGLAATGGIALVLFAAPLRRITSGADEVSPSLS